MMKNSKVSHRKDSVKMINIKPKEKKPLNQKKNNNKPKENNNKPTEKLTNNIKETRQVTNPNINETIVIWADTYLKMYADWIATTLPFFIGDKYPNIKFNVVVKNFAIIQDLLKNTINNQNTIQDKTTIPDIILGGHDWMPNLASNNLIINVNNILNTNNVKNLFLQNAVNAFKYNGNFYGIPFRFENIGLIRNSAKHKNPIKNWNDLQKNGGVMVGVDPYHFYPIQTSFGVNVLKYTDYNWSPIIDMDNINGKKFANKLYEWNKIARLDLPNISWNDALNNVASKGMNWISGPWAIDQLKNGDSTRPPMGDNIAVDPIPSLGGKISKPFIGVYGLQLTNKTRTADLGLILNDILIEYCTNDSIYILNNNNYKNIMYPKSQYLEGKKTTNPIMYGFYKAGLNGVPLPNIPAMNDVWDHWGKCEGYLITAGFQNIKLTKLQIDNLWSNTCKNIQKIINKNPNDPSVSWETIIKDYPKIKSLDDINNNPNDPAVIWGNYYNNLLMKNNKY
jgi:arabinogalactan oligomer/maltooligosaccharide transport system substrate-binding protein